MRIRYWSSVVCSSDLVVHLTHGSQRRNAREADAETLHTTAFMIDRDQQTLSRQSQHVVAELLQLLWIAVVAREQDEAANQRMAQQLAILRRQLLPGTVDHQRAEQRAGGRGLDRTSTRLTSSH